VRTPVDSASHARLEYALALMPEQPEGSTR
jgi:hypothetical protein